MLAVVDDFTRECLTLVPDTSLSGVRVGRELDAIIARRGKPISIVSDNGTELTSMAILTGRSDAKGRRSVDAFVQTFFSTRITCAIDRLSPQMGK